jgi:hypothetical protein
MESGCLSCTSRFSREGATNASLSLRERSRKPLGAIKRARRLAQTAGKVKLPIRPKVATRRRLRTLGMAPMRALVTARR